jgi:hypothetical protein
MKKISICIAAILVTNACKKDKAPSANCDLPKELSSSHESKSASPLFAAYFTYFDFVGKGLGKKSKNAAVKSNINGVQYNYTYVSDAKGRLKEVNGIYVGSGTAYTNQKYIYSYLC